MSCGAAVTSIRRDMSARPIEQWFTEATARWPAVQWPRQAYVQHLGRESPPYPVDLYLAGAAGHRLDAAWEAIESDLGNKARAVLHRQPSADMTAEELWAEAILRLLAEDMERPVLADGRRPAMIIRYRGLVQLLNYLIVIAKRVGIGRKRRMKPTLSLSGTGPTDDPHDVAQNGPTPAQSLESSEDATELAAAVRAAYGQLSAEQKFLIAMVYRNGMKQKQAGAMLGWSEFKTCRSLAAAMESLRKSIARWAGADWNGPLAAAWEQCLQICWNDVQVPSTNASKKSA